jgi:hypothetical protein
MHSIYLPCLVEDCAESNAFKCVQRNKLLDNLYFYLSNLLSANIDLVDEYYRGKQCSSEYNCVEMRVVKVNDSLNDENALLGYLRELSLRASRRGELDEDGNNLVLLFASLSMFLDWLRRDELDMYTHRLSRVPSGLLIEAILFNLLLLTAQVAYTSQTSAQPHTNEKANADNLQQTTQSTEKITDTRHLLTHLKSIEKHELGPIVNSYKEIYSSASSLKKESNQLHEYFSVDLKIVHRMNEFQAIYYVLGAINHLLGLGFEFLLPHRFFSGAFISDYAKEYESNDKHANRVYKTAKACVKFRQLMETLMQSFYSFKKSLNTDASLGAAKDLNANFVRAMNLNEVK